VQGDVGALHAARFERGQHTFVEVQGGRGGGGGAGLGGEDGLVSPTAHREAETAKAHRG